ncbi:uncharacterized protein TrAFT101_007395 [Trichoderma asperellum]|uniref:uncharacterized protein n=1 Tax=Trichoderma asperellum TaxID=101201 RepID=UPI0033246596|nr:hypothetical protein TrAFT101_007395 [Trichoderma asperellum]
MFEDPGLLVAVPSKGALDSREFVGSIKRQANPSVPHCLSSRMFLLAQDLK